MKKLNRIIYVYIFGIILLLVLIVGVTVAFFVSAANVGGNNIGGVTANVSLNLRVSPLSAGINNPLIPQLSDTIQEAVVGTSNGSCVDDNNNTVCQVYEIIVENTGDTALTVNGTITFLADTISDLKWGLGTSATTGFSAQNTYSKTETDLIGPGIADLQEIDLEANDNVSNSGNDMAKFYIVVYIEEKNADQSSENTGSFSATVSFDAAGGNGISATFAS